MTIDRNTVASLGLTLLLVTSVLPAGIVGLSGTASANDHATWYTLSQPGTDVCYEVRAFTNDHEKMEPEVRVRGSNEIGDVTGPYEDPDWDGPVTIESIMDYRYRYYPSEDSGAVGQTEYYAPYLNDQYRYEGWEFGTYGLYNWSENADSHLWFYENANGEVSLVARHDKLYENVGTSSHRPYNGEYGGIEGDGFFVRSNGDGSVTFTFDRLPSGEWAYLDDLYPNDGMSDMYTDADGVRYGHRESEYESTPIREFDGGWFRAEWEWISWNNPDGADKHGTDGGAYRGFENLPRDEPMTITNSFSGDLDDWEVRHNDGTINGEQLDLVMGEPLNIQRGRHCLDGGNGELTASPNPAEVGEEVTFTAPDGATEYRWDWDGDGTPDQNTSDNTVQHGYSSAGDKQVTVTMAQDGQTAQKQTTVTVRQSEPPTADFAVDDAAGDPNYHVVGEEVTLNGSVSTDNVAISSYEWDVNGTADSGATVPYEFDTVGTHEVTLTVTDRTGRTDNVTKTVQVVAQDDPEARASASPTEVEAGAPITLDGSASSDEHGAITSYDWNAPGGSVTAPGQNRTAVTYDEAGTYNVTLTVTDNNGNTDTANRSVSATNATTPTIDMDSVVVPDEVSSSGTFEVTASASDKSALTYTWQFRQDGTTEERTGQTVNYQFENQGSATVELVVTDAAGHTNSTGEIDVEVTGKPNAALSAPEKSTVGKSVTFDASNSTDEGDIVEYRWDFDGDGTYEVNKTAPNATVSTSFSNSGEHTVTVRVVDDDNMTDTANATITVEQKKAYGGGGGSSGASGGSSSFGPPPVLTQTEEVGPNQVAIDVRNARADETIDASLPASEVGNETGVRFKQFAVDLSGEDTHVVFRTAASADAPGDVSPPSASDETLAYLDLGAKYLDSPVENATVTFTVKKSLLGQFARAGDVTVYQYDGTWTQVDATVVETSGDTVRLKATTDGLGTLAVGANEVLTLTDAQLANSSVTTGETVEATATLENRGTTARSATLNLTLSGSVVATKTVEVPAGEKSEVSLSGTAPTPGTYNVSIAGTSAGTLSVQKVQPADVSVADVSLNTSTIAAGEQVAVVATVENTGGKVGEVNVTLTMFGEELASETVRVQPGETNRVTFDRRVDAAGTYTVDVNGETAELKVQNSSDENGDDKAPGVPGFGIGAALVALVGAALLARLRG